MELTATDAARRFSEILDAVEHRGESFVIIRKGRPVALMGPASRANGAALKDLLNKHRVDPDWEKELRQLRSNISIEDRPWTD